MGILLLRRQSDEPTVIGSDDARILRYALSGYNGVTKNFGNECDYEYSAGVFKIKSGEIVVDGYQALIDDVGESINVNNSATKLYYSIYAEYDLRVSENQKVTIKSLYAADTYPIVQLTEEDFTKNRFSVKRFILYSFTIANNVIADVSKKFKTLILLPNPRRVLLLPESVTLTKTMSTIMEGHALLSDSSKYYDEIHIELIITGEDMGSATREFFQKSILSFKYSGSSCSLIPVTGSPNSDPRLNYPSYCVGTVKDVTPKDLYLRITSDFSSDGVSKIIVKKVFGVIYREDEVDE